MNLAHCEDVELVSLAIDGRKAAFNELIARHDGRAFQIALGILKSYDDASDAVQNARIQCWADLSCFDSERGSFCDWFLGIVQHRCLDLHKQRQRSNDWMSIDDVDEMVASPLDALVQCEERSYLRGVLDGAIATLPERQSTAVRMRYLEQCEFGEIARAMGVSEKTARNHVSLGLANLKERLQSPPELEVT